MRSPLTGSPRRKSHGPIAALFAANGPAPEAPPPLVNRFATYKPGTSTIGDANRGASWR